jgi:2-polyprenyl-3-methyl-5-hydroxy-6-metoxy-1,4-benzoquinol methylase
MEKFFHASLNTDRNEMKSRITSTCNALGWRALIGTIMASGIPFDDLQVAEVGCGTGTFSLTLNMLGAKTTLIDADDDALILAKKIFFMYGREASFVKADVLQSVPEGLKGCFDIVISGGLAEHFIGNEREQCILFHRKLLKDEGVAYIGVPNKWSVGYQVVRMFRQVTGTWSITTEVPFTYWELISYAEFARFSKSEVIGNNPILKDAHDYALGIVSALLDLLPHQVRKTFHHVIRRQQLPVAPGHRNAEQEERIIFKTIEQIKKRGPVVHKKSMKDFMSAGIILFGYTGERFTPAT